MDSGLYLRLTDSERRALVEHQRRIIDKDKGKRHRAMLQYRVFLDYLEARGAVTHEQRDKLEYWRM